MVSALDGITVLDLTQGPAGAIAAMFLCDNGARVIRVEPPDSEGLRADPGYKIWDRGKESVVLDIARNSRLSTSWSASRTHWWRAMRRLPLISPSWDTTGLLR
ncbi:MAG: CoA transferase [Chloroflexi bacterium]|nr:CoA transferase [Chloroflexota bacterium]